MSTQPVSPKETPPQTPRLMSLADIQFTGTEFWRPINDQQLTALHSKAQMLMYGGGSGGG
jgi:hypothetical protein